MSNKNIGYTLAFLIFFPAFSQLSKILFRNYIAYLPFIFLPLIIINYKYIIYIKNKNIKIFVYLITSFIYFVVIQRSIFVQDAFGKNSIYKISACILVFFITFIISKNKKNVQSIFLNFSNALGIIIILILFISIYQAVSGKALIQNEYFEYEESKAFERNVLLTHDSLSIFGNQVWKGLFPHHLVLGGIALLSFIVFFYSFFSINKKKYLLYSIASVLLIIGSTSRTALFLLVIVIIYLIKLKYNRGKSIIMIIIFISIILFSIDINNFIFKLNQSETLSARLDLWDYIIYNLSTFSLYDFLFGISNERMEYLAFFLAGSLENQLLHNLLTMGVGAVIGLLIFYFLIFIRAKSSINNKFIRLLLFCTFIITMMTPIFITYYFLGLFSIIFISLNLMTSKNNIY